MDGINLKLTHTKGDLTIASSDVTYSLIRRSTAESSGNRQDRHQEREQDTVKQLTENPVKLTTELTVDPSPAEQKVRDYAATLTMSGVDASFNGFDTTLPAGQQLASLRPMSPERRWTQIYSGNKPKPPWFLKAWNDCRSR